MLCEHTAQDKWNVFLLGLHENQLKKFIREVEEEQLFY